VLYRSATVNVRERVGDSVAIVLSVVDNRTIVAEMWSQCSTRIRPGQAVRVELKVTRDIGGL
jgi:hypothetical protein